jgi:hypothetical protein
MRILGFSARRRATAARRNGPWRLLRYACSIVTATSVTEIAREKST